MTDRPNIQDHALEHLGDDEAMRMEDRLWWVRLLSQVGQKHRIMLLDGGA